jgi:hypothetical protein
MVLPKKDDKKKATKRATWMSNHPVALHFWTEMDHHRRSL